MPLYMELYEIIVVMIVKYGEGCVEDLLVSRGGTRPSLCAAAAVYVRCGHVGFALSNCVAVVGRMFNGNSSKNGVCCVCSGCLWAILHFALW